MANSLHVAKLAEGPRAWNAWRAENPAVVPDLSGLELSVGRRQFGPAQGGPVDLAGADLGGAALEQATLIAANLAGASLIAADLSHARLESADLSGANLAHANLDRADLKEARLDGAILSGTQLGHTRNLTQAQLDSAVGDGHTALPPDLATPAGWQKAPARLARQPRERPKGKAGDPYGVLGVGRRAPRQEIRAAYLRLAKELHPDGRIADPVAAERMKEINDAYQELKGFGGRAQARRSEARRARTVFLVGALTSSAPLLLVGFAWLYFAGYLGAPEKTAARPLPEVGTSSIAKRPDGAAAKREAAWAEAERAGTREAWQRFLEAYPDGERAGRARQAIAAIDATEARQRVELAAWAAAEKSATREGWQRFLDAHPDGERAGKARQAIAAIAATEARQRAELAAWAAAEKSATREGWQRFLEAHPDGERAGKARQAIAAIAAAEARERGELAAWTSAAKTGAREDLERYLAAYPSGSWASEAQERLTALDLKQAEQDDAAWSKARRRNSKTSYEGYLSTHPAGRYAGDARVRLAELERSEAKTPAVTPVKEAKQMPPPAKLPASEAAGNQRWPAADEPFIGADGRIRR